MSSPRAVSVVGYKGSGKTRVVEALVRELTARGYRVGTLKHTAEEVPLDTPGKDTWRHREAGSVTSAILHQKSAAFFIDEYMSVYDAVARLGSIDLVVVEGFKSLGTTARILVPRNEAELEELSNGLQIAAVDLTGGKIRVQGGVPVISIEEPIRLAEIVEKRAFPILSGLNCGGCGYDDCLSLARAILAGEAEAQDCVAFAPGFSLRVNDVEVPLGRFVQDVTRNVLLGLVGSFKGVVDPKRVELEFEVGEEDG